MGPWLGAYKIPTKEGGSCNKDSYGEIEDRRHLCVDGDGREWAAAVKRECGSEEGLEIQRDRDLGGYR